MSYIHIHHNQIQKLRKEHVERVMKLCDINLWRVFVAVRRETKVCQSAVLRAVRQIIHPLSRNSWPADRRQLDRRIARAGGFNCRIVRPVTFEIRGHVIQWRFVDPIYAWTSTANKVSRTSPLYFRYRPRYNDSSERMYGTSVICGDVMRKACERVNSRCVGHYHNHITTALTSFQHTYRYTTYLQTSVRRRYATRSCDIRNQLGRRASFQTQVIHSDHRVCRQHRFGEQRDMRVYRLHANTA